MTDKIKFCYSFDEERFDGEFDTAEEAAQEAFEEAGLTSDNESCFVGEIDKRMTGQFLSKHDIYNLFEQMNENAGEFCGEASEDWLHFPSQVLVKRNGVEQRALHAKKMSKEELAKRHASFLIHDKGVEELTEKIRFLLNEWADAYGHRPTFWGVKNVKSVPFR